MEALVALSLNKVYDHLQIALGEEYELIKKAPNELEKLKRLKLVIFNVQKDVVIDHDSNQYTLTDWLDEMNDAAYDVEDTIDIFETEKMRTLHRRSNNIKMTTRFIYRVIDFFSSANPLFFRHKMGSSVQKRLGRLTDIVNERGYHLTHSGSSGVVGNLGTNMHDTFSYIGGDVVLGREEDLEIIIKRLLKVQTTMEVVVLVGMGGVGKTALAKLVYNDSQVNALFGERKVWVCVPGGIVDLPKILKLVIEQIDPNSSSKLEGLQALTKKLIELFEENMYLLVLDNVWTNASLSMYSWSEMKSLFRNCKIMVTTREEKVTSVISSESYMHRVKCLPEDVCWSLFMKMAFGDKKCQASQSIVRSALEKIGKRIVEKCKGLPLAVRVLGSMMGRNQDHSYWMEIEKSNIFESIEGENEIFGILKFSYNNLPSKSRFCFAYCSIFPKASVMNKMDLIQQWTDSGFIVPNHSNQTKEMEHIGKEIFEDLLSRCFFQDVEEDYLGNIKSFKMHDLIHDLAQSIAKYHCGILNNENQVGFLSNKTKIRFLSIDMGKEASSEIPIKLDDIPTLRTLQSFSPQIINEVFLVDCFTRLKFLRVLNCSGASIDDVPSSIDSLKLLRYVDFSKTYIKKLPETVCRLQNLQTIKLNFCMFLIGLPKNMRKLSKLRHLEINDCDRVDTMPVRMDQLSLLQTLSNFTVNNDGANLNELRQLKLGGSLIVEYLGRTRNVAKILDLSDGIFTSKENLISLDLSWERRIRRSGRFVEMNEKIDEHVLSILQPHANLKQLRITSFDGIRFPTWMSDSSQLLVSITLDNCNQCLNLPAFGQLRYLRILNVMGLKRVENIDETFYGVSETDGFPSLEELQLINMPAFREWSDVPSRTIFPKLSSLKLQLQHLEVMPQIPTLRQLSISECKSLFLLRLVAKLPSLSTLDIGDISNLTCLTDDYFKSLTALKKLSIWCCENLESFSETALKCTSSLQHLEITYCSMFKSLPQNMACLQSLKNLEIEYCSSLVNVSDGLKCLNSLSLRSIKIVGCFGIKYWSDHAIQKISSVEESRIEICSKDNVELLSRWLQNSKEILQSLRINGGHGTGQHTIYRVPGKRVVSICCFEKLEVFPKELMNMSVLERLEIVDCPNFSCLPSGRLNVKYLGIENCHLLKAHCEGQGYLISNVNRTQLDI
ncbi:NB-ARC domain-containing disease resistance protein [Zostera marina]|uniref:NB-ARC domain-containing disease resistance protein n=1 Tax=Zostera marina TaxID=29655 RepID=A0A0K9NJ72_ZOSMR|nr:NB-ARC domain-containing disease resistance protein [Zostera marina]